MLPVLLGTVASSKISTPAFDLIGSTILGTASGAITFSNLNTYSSSYKHLQIRYTAKNTNVSNNVIIRFNNITTDNYAKNLLISDGATFSVENAISAGSILLTGGQSQSTTAGAFAGGVIDILDPFNSSKNTTIRAFYGRVDSNTSLVMGSGLFISTDVVTSITISTGPDQYAIGSRFSIYGIRG